MQKLRGVRRAIETPFNDFGHAVQHMQEQVCQTTVGLRVFQRMMFVACHAEVARTDEDCVADSKVAATNSKRRCRPKTNPEEKRPVKLFCATKVQPAGTWSTLEACVSRKDSPVELAHKSFQALANTVSQIDVTVQLGVVDMTVPSNSSITSDLPDCTCNEPWNPFSPDLKDVDRGTKCNGSMLLTGQISDSKVESNVSFDVTEQVPDHPSTHQFVTSKSPEEERAKNPFDIDDKEAASTASQLWEPVSNNYGAEEWANNPLTEDFAKAADVEHEDHIPNEGVLQPIRLIRTAKFVNRKNIGSVGAMM